MKTSLKPDYGNWVPKKLLVIAAAVALVAAALLIASVCFAWGWLWTTVIALLLCFVVALLAYMTLSYRAFSHHGGGFMEKVHRYVAGKLPWNGEGTLLDVGCGAGALTILCAKKFPKAKCTGIDYWGIMWDYSHRMCQHNAEAEGVADRCTFLHGDANRLDFADETFDAVVSNFVYHEVTNCKDKERLIRETLRVLKKGGVFALQDLYGQHSVYGDFEKTIERLKADAVSEIHYADSCKEIPVPKWMMMPGMLPGVGIIYGRK